MNFDAIIENIEERIKQELSKAQNSIFIVATWFTNQNLFSQLLSKAIDGCSILLIISNDQINLNSGIEFDELNIDKSEIEEEVKDFY